MKYFLDTEFHEDGRTIDLMSIGVVAEDGREYYAVSSEIDWDRLWSLESCDWLRKNVIPFIDRSIAIPRAQIRHDLLAFLSPSFSPSDADDDRLSLLKPEFWGYYADYDWVALCQLWGRMIDLPTHFPKFCRDIKQFAVDVGNPKLPPPINEHNALDDARWNKQAYDFLVEHVAYQRKQNPTIELNKFFQ